MKLLSFVVSCFAADASVTADVAAKLAIEFPSEEFALLSDVAEAAALRSAAASGISLAATTKDYSVTCPKGWADAGDGEACSAPLGYAGPCGDVISFGGLAPSEKEALAKQCQAVFVDSSGCSPDYSKLCPTNWADSGDGMCEAPVGYNGPCVRSKDFSRISASAKGVFADACAVSWPCSQAGSARESGELLSKNCGRQCMGLLEEWETQPAGSSHPDMPKTLGAAVAHAERSSSHAVQWLDASRTSVGSSDGVPCSTPAACAIKARGANKCNYARAALQKTYEDLNVATHVLGTMISSMCGCVRVGDVSSCLLKSMPAVCTFPYQVYSKAFSTSVSVWEAVKASSVQCSLHMDPSVSL